MKKVLALLVAMSASASAATVSYSHVTSSTATPFTDNFTLQKFDPTVFGTLTGILINFSTSITAEVDVFNNTGANQTFTAATATSPLTLTGPAGATVNANAVAGPFNGTAAPGFTPFGGLTGNNSASITVAPVNFGLYTGTGAATAAFQAVAGNGTYSGTSVPGVFFGGSAIASGTSTITYTYSTAAPEPATMGLLGSALLGLGFLKFRTKKS